ncbi:hypothetical protein [Sphingobacterium siyangense]|uniref:hypothetical protein n=1 Tax=Sphingobacterium siyangense TaxID=459529 RepID=UPI002FDAC720
MNLNKTILILCLLLTNAEWLKGQNILEMPNVIPPSPNAQTFTKYGDFPVSNYTGIPDITIPIYNISLKDITSPISLSYNASGIRVNEEASRVGLGWTLNAGGVISHNIRETNDFYSYNYLNNPGDNDLPDLKGINPSSYTIQHNYIINAYNPDQNTPWGPDPLKTYWRVRKDLVNKTQVPFVLPPNLSYDKFISGVSFLDINVPELGNDYEPDIFTYNFSGYSGKFIILRNGQILKEKEDNLKIEYTLNSTSMTTDVIAWTVTVPDGTKYYFNEIEKVRFVDRPQMDSYNSSFYLTKVETIKGSVINFVYKKSSMLLTSFSNLQNSRDLGQLVQTSPGFYELVYLDNIQFNGGRIRFEYLFDREDNVPDPRLKTIFVDNGTGSNLKKYEFLYDYFNANFSGVDIPTLEQLNLVSNNSHYYVNGGQRGAYTKSWNEKRLKLTSIKILGNNESNFYKFEYNESSLPTKLSSSIDHWGYFNGALNNRLIPNVVQKEGFQNGRAKFTFGGLKANRDPNSDFNSAFILQKIKYPTGGETRFYFESNRFHTDNFENDPYKIDLMYNRVNNMFEESQAGGLNNMPHQTRSLHIENSAKLFNISFEFVLDKYLYSGDPSLEVTIKKNINDTSPVFKQVFNGSNFLPVPPISENKAMSYYTQDIWLEPGDYIFMVGGSLFKQLKSIKANAIGILGPEEYIKSNYLGTGGGLRIKIIDNYDSTDRLVLGKSFKYTNNYFRYDYYSPGFSSGKLMFQPRYRKNRGYETSEGLRGNGYSVGYSKVYITDIDPIDNKKNGVTLYEYINKPDRNLYYKFDFGDFDYAKDINPPGIDGFRYQENGTLLKDSLFIDEGQNLKLVKASEYVNQIVEGDIVWAVNRSRYSLPNPSYVFPQGDVYIHEQVGGAGVSDIRCTRLNFLYPAIRPIWVRLDQKIETLIENNLPIRTTTNYTYNQTYHHIIKEESTMANEVLKTFEYKYPPDVVNNTTIGKLTLSNRINIPVEIKTTVKDKLSHIINEYEMFGNSPQLSLVKSNTGINGTFEPRLQYQNYDIYGNILQIARNREAATVFLWGYNGQYPVLEIKNATYAEVSTVLTQAAIDNLNSSQTEANMEILIKNASDKLRTNLPKAMVTSYTYKPLVGMTSKTDARGIKETYIYDGMQRLQAILDHLNYVNRSFDYHYRSN